MLGFLSRSILFVILAGVLASSPLAAQWIRHPQAGAPRGADGTVVMSAATPRTPDGKPDFSGIWTSDEVDPRRPNVPPNPRDATTSRRMINIGVELPGGLPYQPWLAALVKERWAKNAVDDPHVRCFPDNFLRAYGTPHLLKFAQMPGLLIVLNEWNAGYRQIHTDGRALPGAEVPGLAGMPAGNFAEQMKAFRSGSRTSSVMQQLAKGFSDAQVDQLARYFASLPAGAKP